MITFNKDKQSLAINLPWVFPARIFDFVSKTKEDKVEKEPKEKSEMTNSKFSNYIDNFKSFAKKRWFLIFVIVGLLIIGGLYFTKPQAASQGPSANAPINKKIVIPIRNQEGNETGASLSVNATTLERTNRVLYQGRPLLARESKDFAIFNIEIENSTKDRLTVRPADFVRLVDTSGKNYAPDIQTSSIKSDPLSTKKTRVIFIVNENQKNLKFLFGEINANRETIEVTL